MVDDGGGDMRGGVDGSANEEEQAMEWPNGGREVDSDDRASEIEEAEGIRWSSYCGARGGQCLVGATKFHCGPASSCTEHDA